MFPRFWVWTGIGGFLVASGKSAEEVILLRMALLWLGRVLLRRWGEAMSQQNGGKTASSLRWTITGYGLGLVDVW